jgi:MATE family multidrug resistance protein
MEDSAPPSRPPGAESLTELPPIPSAEGTFEEPIVADAALTLDEQRPRERRDILTGPLRPALFLLAVPVLLEQFVNFLVGTCDIWLAGHLPDAAQSTPATTAVGFAAYVGWLASMLYSLVAAGTTALVARHWGAGQRDDAARVANCSIGLALIAGILFLAVIWPLAPELPRLLQLPPTASDITVRYLRIDGIGLVFTAISLVAAAALRGTGDMRTPLIALGTVSIVNLIVSAALVYGWGPLPQLGVDGIVLGTVVARLAGGLLIIGFLLRPHSDLRLRWSELLPRTKQVRRILRIGLPAAGDGLVLWCGHFLFLGIINQLGEVALAAHMVGIRIEAVTYLPAVAWSAAAATMVGQSLGRGDNSRARAAGHEAVRQCGLVGIGVTLFFFFGAGPIFQWMHSDPRVVELGASAFPIVALFQVPLVVGIIYAASLRGAGDTRFPLLMTAVSTFGVRVPLSWLLAIYYDLGLFGAWSGMCADMGLRGLMAAARFARGRWQRIEV